LISHGGTQSTEENKKIEIQCPESIVRVFLLIRSVLLRVLCVSVAKSSLGKIE